MTEPAPVEHIPAEGKWDGDLGQQWADRNDKTIEELDAQYLKSYGVSRTTLAGWMLRDIPRTASILEVGASLGLQLDVLRSLGFSGRMHACDINPDVVAQCRWPADVADIRNLPYPDNSFELVFTSGVFMHVPLEDKLRAADEMVRVARRYLWGFEVQAYRPITQFYTKLPPGYFIPLELFWRQHLPEAAIMRVDTWRGPEVPHSTFAYLIDMLPNEDVLTEPVR